MKLILGSAGSGKSFTVVEEASKHTNEGRSVRIISSETPLNVYQERAEVAGIDPQYCFLTFRHFDTIADIVLLILKDTVSDVILIDVPIPFKEDDLELLRCVTEDYKKKSLYVAVQTNRGTQMDKKVKVVSWDTAEGLLDMLIGRNV